MTITLEHGTTKVDDALFAQEVSIEETCEISEIVGMVNGRAEVVDAFDHTTRQKGSVKGHGPVTIAPGVGACGVDGATGLVIIDMVKYTEVPNKQSAWEYSWQAFPSIAAA